MEAVGVQDSICSTKLVYKDQLLKMPYSLSHCLSYTTCATSKLLLINKLCKSMRAFGLKRQGIWVV
jgi:hypothetical protein